MSGSDTDETEEGNSATSSTMESIMTTAAEAFESIQRYLALFFLVVGFVMLVIGIIAASTEWFAITFDMSVYEAWRVAGIFAGIGLPLMIVGLFTILPATNTQRLGAGIGLMLVIAGVILFAMNFPNQWYGDETDRTFLVVSTYFTGAVLTLFYLFLSVANFQTPVPSTPDMPSTPSSPYAKSGEEATVAEEVGPDQAHRTQEDGPNTPAREAAIQNQNPQTAATLLKSILGLLFSSRDEPRKEEIEEVDLEEIMDDIEEQYDDDAIESIQEIDDHIVIKRTENIYDAEFKRHIPQYVTLVDQKETKYALQADKATFYFRRKYEPDR